MKIDDQSFVSQRASEDVLRHVTTLCGECYHELHEGEVIYYDLQRYRYLCESCAVRLSEQRMKSYAHSLFAYGEEEAGLF